MLEVVMDAELDLMAEWFGSFHTADSHPLRALAELRTNAELEAENARLRAALEQLKDYFDLGEVVFEVSKRFVHAEKLINDTLASVKEMPHA